MFRLIVVESTRSTTQPCSKCDKSINQGTLRASTNYTDKVKYCHLRCYKPPQDKPINFNSDVLMKHELSDEDQGRVKQWVEEWNSKFVITEEKLPEKYRSKRVDTVSTSARRRLLEVFQYLTVREIEVLVALTCKEWFHVSRDEELWKGKYLLVFQPASTEAEACYRTKYIAMDMGSCWICKKFVELTDMKMICPLRKRPVCTACRKAEKGRVVSFHSYCRWFKVASNLSELIRFPVFKNLDAKCVYVIDMCNLMVPYAERRREMLLQCLETEYSNQLNTSTFDLIRSIDLQQLYKQPGQFAEIPLALLTFLGKNEAKENLHRNLQILVQKLLQEERKASNPELIFLP